LALQVFHEGKLVSAEKLDFPASAKKVSLVAFSHHNRFVMNLTCAHRHEDYESQYAFSVDMFKLRIVNGGPVISEEVVEQKKQEGKILQSE
ncbi:MAG: hypothetical protein AAF226_01945, partial [Verrucomicrobiota bacterium]